MVSISRQTWMVCSLVASISAVSARAERYEAPDVFRLERPAPAFNPTTDKTPADYWRTTGLKLKNYFDDVTDHCYDNLQSFRGCYEGLAAIANASRVGGTSLGTIEEQLQGHPALGSVLENLPFGLTLFTTLKPKDRLEQREFRNRARSIHARATETLFKSGARIDFKALIQVMAGRALVGANKDNEAYFASTLYNKFLGATDDPHSRFSPTAMEMDEFAGVVRERPSGVGVQTTLRKDGHLIVYRVVRASPADRAGLRRNDDLLEIDGESVIGKTLAQLNSLIRGEAGTFVTFKVKRADGEKLIRLERGAIVTDKINGWIVQDTGVPIGYIRMDDFLDKQGSKEVAEAIVELTRQGARGFILDLRGNGGGLLPQAFDVSELFVGKKLILSVMDLDRGHGKPYVGSRDPLTKLPLAVLIDAGSASASEITAGAIQDNQRGWIVGDRSYGKGSVQGLARYDFKSYKGNRGLLRDFDLWDPKAKIRYRKTQQRFYQPSGRTNQIQGIIPNFSVDPFPGATEADRVQFREEDNYDNALPAIDRPWVETRPALVARINECRDTAKADAWFKTMSASDVGLDPPDYRLYAAEDILRCQLVVGQ